MMTAGANTLLNGHCRPFKFQRDMKEVSDLIELCFADTLDPDGKRYLNQMRRAAQQKKSRLLANVILGKIHIPTDGYIWEVGQHIVGNLSLIPFLQNGKRLYMIANVAVHPDFRRRGIARALTQAAVDKAKKVGSKVIWLQVRDDNPNAIELYHSIGFQIQVRRTTWKLNPRSLSSDDSIPLKKDRHSNANIASHLGRHWRQQRIWLETNYPNKIRWHLPIKTKALRPGITGAIHRMFEEVTIRKFCVQQGKEFLGLLAWQSSHSHADYLWLVAPEKNIPQVFSTALAKLLTNPRIVRPMILEFPADIGGEVFQEFGFKKQYTLLWMSKILQRTPR